MKTFLDRFRRKGKGDEPSEGVPDLFANAKSDVSETKTEPNGPSADVKPAGIALTPVPVAKSKTSDTHVRLQLGDFLHRIPQNLLRPGPHDVSAELLFNINDLSALIAKGQTTLNLAEIHRRAPGIFRNEVVAEDKIEIRFPWQKLMHLVKSPGDGGTGASGITPAAAEALAHKFRSRRPARNILPAAGAALGGKGTAGATTPAFREPAAKEKAGSSAQPETESAEQLSWFNKPPVEKAPAAPATAEPAAPTPPQPVAAVPEGQGNFNRDDLVRARDAATLKFTEAKAEIERQSEAFAAEREALAEERDRAVAELERARAELAAKVRHIEQHEHLGAQHAEETAETIAQREALQKEVEAKNAQLATLSDEIAALRHGSGEKAATTTQEREALLADLANVRRELAEKCEQIEFQQSLGAKSAEDGAKLAAEREALQKQVAEQAAALDAIKSELDGLRQGGGKKFAAIAEERDKVLADLQQTRKELADKIDQIELQQSLTSKSTEDATRLAAEREALQQELAAKNGDLETIKSQLDALSKTSEEKLAAVTGDRDKVAADLDQVRRELAEKIGHVEQQQNLSAKNAEEAAQLAAEREALKKEVAAKTADLEAIKTELHELRKGGGEQYAAVAGERDTVRAELARAREELAAKVAETELQERLAGTSAQEIAAANARREAVEKELAEKSAQLNALTAELESHKKEGGEKLAAILQERDSLLQHKTTLTAQLAQASGGLAAKQKAGVEVDLIRKENKRQVEELQRRISAFESGQRATSQELNRERETRIKAERALAAAERTRQEASAMIESMRNETRREGDAAARKRESESARLQKELQERIEALTETNRKAVVERDERIAELEKARAEAASSLEAFKTAAVADAAKGAQWESRAVAGLEEDVTKYRERIKALLHERDAAASAAKTQIETLTREREVAAQELENATAAHGKSAAEQKRAIEELEAKAAAIEKEKAAVFQELEQVRQALAQHTEQLAAAQSAAHATGTTAAELRQQLDKLTGERDRVQADWEKSCAELKEARAEAKRQSEQSAAVEKAHETALASLRRQAADLQQSLDAVTGERTELHKQLEAAAANLQRAESERVRELAAMRAEQASLLATHQAASGDFAKNLDAHEKTLAGFREEIGGLKSALDAMTGERAELQKHLEAATAEHRRIQSEHEAQMSAVRGEHASLLAEHLAASGEFAKNLTAREETLDGLRAEIGGLKSALDSMTGERAELQTRLESATADLDRIYSEHELKLSGVHSEYAGLLAAHRSASDEFAGVLRGHEAAAAELRNEISGLKSALDARAEEGRQFQKEIKEGAAKLDRAKSEHEKQIADLNAGHARELAKHQAAADDLAKTIGDHEKIVAALRGEIDAAKNSLAALTGERGKLHQDLEAAMALLDQARAEHDKHVSALRAEHADALSVREAASGELSKALKGHEQTIAGLRGEIGELKKSVASLTGERGQAQKKLEAAKAEAKKAKTEHEKQLAAIRAEQGELRSAHQAASNEFAAALDAHRGIVSGLQQEIQRHLAAAATDIERTKSEYEEQLSATRAAHEGVLANHLAASDELARAVREHESAIATLQSELSKAKAEAARELAYTKADDGLSAQIREQRRKLQDTAYRNARPLFKPKARTFLKRLSIS